MPRNFNLSDADLAACILKDPKFLVRIGLGMLLIANLVAASFAFNLFGASPGSRQPSARRRRRRLQAAQAQTRTAPACCTVQIGKGKMKSDTFLANYTHHPPPHLFDDPQRDYPAAKTAGMTMKEATIAPLDPIEGSDDLA